MMTTLPLILMAAAIVVVVALRARSLRPKPIVEAGATSTHTPVLVLSGRVGEAGPLTASVGATLQLAPLRETECALRIHAPGGTVLADVAAADVVMLRMWSRGELVCATGRQNDEFGRRFPVDGKSGDWELYLVSAQGEILHCYGGRGACPDADIARLTARIEARVLHPAV